MNAQQVVEVTFTNFCDVLVDELTEIGASSDLAIEILFETATALAEDGTLPEFPDDTNTWHDKARWLVAAVDADFRGLVVRVLKGS